MSNYTAYIYANRECLMNDEVLTTQNLNRVDEYDFDAILVNPLYATSKIIVIIKYNITRNVVAMYGLDLDDFIDFFA